MNRLQVTQRWHDLHILARPPDTDGIKIRDKDHQATKHYYSYLSNTLQPSHFIKNFDPINIRGKIIMLCREVIITKTFKPIKNDYIVLMHYIQYWGVNVIYFRFLSTASSMLPLLREVPFYLYQQNFLTSISFSIDNVGQVCLIKF